MIRHQPITLLAVAVSILLLLLIHGNHYDSSIIAVYAYMPQNLQRTNDIRSRGFRSGSRNRLCQKSPLPIDGCKWGLTSSLHAAKSKSGTFRHDFNKLKLYYDTTNISYTPLVRLCVSVRFGKEQGIKEK